MKKIIISFGFIVLLLGFSVQSFAHCEKTIGMMGNVLKFGVLM